MKFVLRGDEVKTKAILKQCYRYLPFKPHIFAALRTLSLPEVMWRHLYFEGPFTVWIDPARSFRMNHYGDKTQNELFWLGLGSYEQTSIHLWCHLAAKASVIVDGGAHTGLYSLIAGAVNPRATIFAFEPEPRVYERLVNNLRLNPFRVTAEMLALSDAGGSQSFYVPLDEHPVSSSLDSKYALTGMDVITARTVKLDDYLKLRGVTNVDLVKLDVERYEPAVLRGMKELLSRSRPTIILEVLEDSIGSAVMDAVHGCDYRTFIIQEGSGITPVKDLSPAGRIGQNFILCDDNVAHELSKFYRIT